MADEYAFDVFLSHSAKDKLIVLALAERLDKDGLRVWLDDWVITGGEHIPTAIEQGLKQSRILALCMSVNGFGSDWVTAETWTRLFNDPINKARRFVTLRLDDAPCTDMLKPFKAINWVAPTAADYQQLRAALLISATPVLASPAQAMAPAPRPASPPASSQYSAACQAFWDKLFENNQAGWNNLKAAGLVNLFQTITAEHEWTPWPESAQAFFDFCTNETRAGFDFINFFLEVIEADEQNGRGVTVWGEPVRLTLLALSGAAIDCWINHASRGVPLVRPILGNAIRLELAQPWAAYLLAVFVCKLSGQIPANIDDKNPVFPTAFIQPLAPLESLDPADMIRPATDALAAVTLGIEAVKNKPPSQAFAAANQTRRKKSLGGSDPVFAVHNRPEYSAMHTDDFCQAVYAAYGLHVVIFGDQQQCSAALRQFIYDLTHIITQLNQKLHHQPKKVQLPLPSTPLLTLEPTKPPKSRKLGKSAKGDPMAATTINNFYKEVNSVGDHNTAAQATAPGAQAAGRDIINQSADTAAFTTLLNAFMTEMAANAVLKPKHQALVEASVADLKDFAAQADRGPDAAKKVKDVLDEVDQTLAKIDDGLAAAEQTATQLLSRWDKVKAWAIGAWPTIAALLNQAGDAS